MKSLQTISINPANAILIIVDMQNEFCKPGGARYTETSARIMPEVIPAVRGLVDKARTGGIPILYIQSVRTLQEPEFTVFGRDPHLQLGSWGAQIIEELKPREKDIIVPKFSHDPFYRIDLDQVLKRLVPEPTNYYAVVTGGAVNVCVYHTTMGFYLRNYWTVVPIDCVFYVVDFGKETALQQFSLKAYPNIFLSRSDLIQVSPIPSAGRPALIPGS